MHIYALRTSGLRKILHTASIIIDVGILNFLVIIYIFVDILIQRNQTWVHIIQSVRFH